MKDTPKAWPRTSSELYFMHDYVEEYWADRSDGALDPEGPTWWFTRRVRG